MARGETITVVEAALAGRRWRLWLLIAATILVFLIGLAALFGGAFAYWRYGRGESAPVFESELDHFHYGSIGSEVSSGIPYWSWQALPRLFPEAFENRTDYAAFGFLYEKDAAGTARDLPIGVSRRHYRGVDMVWFNCALCHTGTWRPDAAAQPRIVSGMPANNLDFSGFVKFLLVDLAVDTKLTPEKLVEGAQSAGAEFGPIERLVWLNVVGPRLREGLLARRKPMLPLLAAQPDWGPGRVDTFNPYKVIQMRIPYEAMSKDEVVGNSDFPSIFQQAERTEMNLHWDGNNRSLAERNLSAAIGAGVTPATAEISSIQRVSSWIQNLKPPPSPHRPEPAATARGRALYMQGCASCHGHQDRDGFAFEGGELGEVTPIAEAGTDRNRLDSYTQAFRDRQVSEIFRDTPFQFRYFVKTNGYANQPLDGLWLRGPYLHNGSVPTLAALLAPPNERPRAFIRGLDIVDAAQGGFVSPACDPGKPVDARGAAGHRLVCFDTDIRGNGHAGHLWGTDLTAEQKKDLLAYLLTF